MIPRFSDIAPNDFNQNMIDNLYLFYAEIFTPNGADEKWTRCRHESAIAFQIENSGQNILHVGHLRSWKEDKFRSNIKTPGCNIEYLTEEIIEI